MVVHLLLLKSVSSVVKVVVGAAISVKRERRKVSSLVPSHLISSETPRNTRQAKLNDLNSPSNFIIPSVSPAASKPNETKGKRMKS